MELWDAYDSSFQKVEGVTLVRGEAIPRGLHHLVCDVLVRHADGSYLLMQRDPGKQFGLMWEATAGGSALQGETPLECALRELREETGIVADTLTEVGRDHEPGVWYVEFLYETDWDKNRITLQEGETVAFQWVSREQLLSMRENALVTQRMQQFIGELRRQPVSFTNH